MVDKGSMSFDTVKEDEEVEEEDLVTDVSTVGLVGFLIVVVEELPFTVFSVSFVVLVAVSHACFGSALRRVMVDICLKERQREGW